MRKENKPLHPFRAEYAQKKKWGNMTEYKAITPIFLKIQVTK